MKKILALAATAAAAAILVPQAPANAQTCPAGTESRTWIVAGHAINVCEPHIDCDPGACLALPAQ
jgi:hypothetical protein